MWITALIFGLIRSMRLDGLFAELPGGYLLLPDELGQAEGIVTVILGKSVHKATLTIIKVVI